MDLVDILFIALIILTLACVLMLFLYLALKRSQRRIQFPCRDTNNHIAKESTATNLPSVTTLHMNDNSFDSVDTRTRIVHEDDEEEDEDEDDDIYLDPNYSR